MDSLHKNMKFSSLPPSPSMDLFKKTSTTGFSRHRPSPTAERRQRQGQDRLSDLPEPLLHHIFSFLPTNEVNRTTYRLSKKWALFWASFPYIYFDIKEYEYEYSEHWDISDFEDFEDWISEQGMDRRTDFEDVRFYSWQQYVDKYMHRRSRSRSRSGLDLQGFRLRWPLCSNGYRVKNWIGQVMKLNVQELDIFLGLTDSVFTIPAKVFSAASSVKAIKLELRFDGRSFNQYRFHVPRSMISAPNLRTLELIRVKLQKGNAYGELILDCPVLETLILKNCYCKHLKVLNLSLNQLKRLEIDNRANNSFPYVSKDALGDCKLQLNTPNVSTFVYKGDMYKDCSLGDFAALTDVNISLHPRFVITRPGGLSHLNLSTISKNANSLELLKGLNGARNLVLGELERWRKKKEEPVLPFRPLHHLKYIAVRRLEGDKSEIEFLRTLLKNAVNLERLVVTVDEPENLEIKRDNRLKFHTELMELSQQYPNIKVSFELYKSYKANDWSTFIHKF
ncbi:hypothetical protein Scep_028532 [Stephania cephalantha]|uniref:F-box domain-containing protein n=1 Tax=Stephania cephalantha TaxID=152367 RepID=A0AAP0EC86_9MAGN